MNASCFAILILLTAVTALTSWRPNPLFAGRPRLRLNLLSATGVAVLALLAVYVVGLTMNQSPALLGITGAEAVVVGVAGVMSLRVRAVQMRRRRNGERA